MSQLPLFVALIGVFLCASVAHSQTPLNADVTYQGELKLSGAPLDNTADFEFKLFNAVAGGVQQGNTNAVSNVNVVDGVFTVSLNFGVPAFNGDVRFLQIAVRSPAGSGNFTTLSPRQPMTAVPYALYALTGPGSGGPWAVNGNNVFNTNNGNVGIGTNAPEAKLQIQGVEEGLRIQGPGVGAANSAWLGFNDSTGTRVGYVGDASSHDNSVYLESDAGSVHLATAVGAALTATSAGNVGVGTTIPAAKLDVRGDIHLGISGQFFAAAGDENLRIIRGKVNGNGTPIAGAGFSSVRTSVGQYTITFNTSFNGVPIMVGSPEVTLPSTGFNWVFIDAGSSSQMNVILLAHNGSGPQDGVFQFIAVGPR